MVTNFNLGGLAQQTPASCLALTQRWLVAHYCICARVAYYGPGAYETDNYIQGGSYDETWTKLQNDLGLTLPPNCHREDLKVRTRDGFKQFADLLVRTNIPLATVIPACEEGSLLGTPRIIKPTGGIHSVIVVDSNSNNIWFRYPRPTENGQALEMTWDQFLSWWDSAATGLGREAIAIVPMV